MTKYVCTTSILVVKDASAARDFYVSKLGFEVSFEWGTPPVYVGLKRDDIELHLNTASNSPHEPGKGTVSITTDEVDELYLRCKENNVEILVVPDDRAYGLRDFSIRDLDGNAINFGCVIV